MDGWQERRTIGGHWSPGFHCFHQSHWEEGGVMILLNSIVTFEPRPDCGHSPSDAWKLRWSWFGKSLSVSFLNKGLRLIHLLLDLGCKYQPKRQFGTEVQELSSSGPRKSQVKLKGIWCFLKWLILGPQGCFSRCQPWGSSRTSPSNSPLLRLGPGLFERGPPHSGHSSCPLRWLVASWSLYQAQAPGSALVPKRILGGE